MAHKTKKEILDIITFELQMSYGGDTLATSLKESLGLYLGVPNGKEVEGRSTVTSTDVADAIEWMMPQIMKSFTQNNEVVVFDPVHEGDEKQAEMESEYVYEILMKQNDGFIILHQFVKDALMQKNGILKVYYSETTKHKISNWTGITQDQFEQLVGHDEVELLEHSDYIDQVATIEKQQVIKHQVQQLEMMQQQAQQPEQLQQIQMQLSQLAQDAATPVTLHDVKVSVKRKQGQIYVDPVPREEFRVNSNHNSLSLENARFTAHETQKPIWEVIQEYGISEKDAEDLPEKINYPSDYRFALQDENLFYPSTSSEDEEDKQVAVIECYLNIDIDNVGIPKYMKITVAGEWDNPSEILWVEELDMCPWVATTAFIMSHKFEGLSVTDRLKEIQDQKTTLWRNMFDNMYLQNNQRNKVIENQVNMDDLLVSRPGGVVRVKRMDALEPLATPQLGQDAYNMMEYLDRVRAGRVGVDPDGNASPQDIGDRVGSEGVDRLLNAKEELVGLVVRVIAETGVKPLCLKIRDLAVKNLNAVHDFKFRGVWQKVNPSQWLDRSHCTVRVGTGTGHHQGQITALTQVLEIQEKIHAAPGQALVDEVRTFNALDDFCKFSGLNGATRYFIDPTSPEGKDKRQKADQSQNQIQQLQLQSQQKMEAVQQQLANAEMLKVQAQQHANESRHQVEMVKAQLQQQKQAYEAQLEQMRAQIEHSKNVGDEIRLTSEQGLRKYEIDTNAAIELAKLDTAAESTTSQGPEGDMTQHSVEGGDMEEVLQDFEDALEVVQTGEDADHNYEGLMQ